MRIRAPLLALGVVLGSVAGCSDDWLPMTSGVPTNPESSSSSSSSGSSSGSTTGGPATTGVATTEAPTSSSTGEPTTGDGGGGMCNIWNQDCADGLKCTAFAPPNTFIPQGIKCVPVPDNPKAHNEPCGVGPEGLGDDDCDVGSVCLDLDYDGAGFCLPYCTGDSQNPMCAEDRTCVKLFFSYDFGNCFRKCDPLLQDCETGEGCYMDATTVGNTGFVCLPVVQEGKGKVYGDPCIGWSSCEPGFACVFDYFVAGCQTGLCCTPWCDLSEGDAPCKALHESMSMGCIPWYPENEAPPGLEKVGVCGIPE